METGRKGNGGYRWVSTMVRKTRAHISGPDSAAARLYQQRQCLHHVATPTHLPATPAPVQRPPSALPRHIQRSPGFDSHMDKPQPYCVSTWVPRNTCTGRPIELHHVQARERGGGDLPRPMVTSDAPRLCHRPTNREPIDSLGGEQPHAALTTCREAEATRGAGEWDGGLGTPRDEEPHVPRPVGSPGPPPTTQVSKHPPPPPLLAIPQGGASESIASRRPLKKPRGRIEAPDDNKSPPECHRPPGPKTYVSTAPALPTAHAGGGVGGAGLTGRNGTDHVCASPAAPRRASGTLRGPFLRTVPGAAPGAVPVPPGR